jgi:hypothetical protein
MRHFLVAGLLLCATSACIDRHERTTSIAATAPAEPALTVKNLPSTASSVCVANVGERDRLLATKAPTAQAELQMQRRIRALSILIADVCF